MLNVLTKRKAPQWLDDITKKNFGEIPFEIKTILEDSLFYPAAGSDGGPVKDFGGYVYSFVYADYGYGISRIISDLKNPERKFTGYNTLACREISKKDLVPEWNPPDLSQNSARDYKFNAGIEQVDGFDNNNCCLWAILERQLGFTDEHGPQRFSLLYVNADYLATFIALYIDNHIKPSVLYAKQHGFAGVNVNNMCSIDSILTKTVFGSLVGKPDYCAYAFDGGGRRIIDFQILGGKKVCEFVTVNEATYTERSMKNITDLWCFL